MDAGTSVYRYAGLGRKSIEMSGRAKRVLIYTISLLTAPMPLMPFEKGTREFVMALMVCGLILTLSSFYVVKGEFRVKSRPLYATKMLIAAIFTLVFGLCLLAGSIWHFSRS